MNLLQADPVDASGLISALLEYGMPGIVIAGMGFALYYQWRRNNVLDDRLDNKNQTIVELANTTTRALTEATIVMSKDGHRLSNDEIAGIVERGIAQYERTHKRPRDG